MAFFDWEAIVGPLLYEHDILGAKGCAWPVHRCSLLVSVDERRLDEHNLSLRVTQFFPEGFGYTNFAKDHLNVPRDARCADNIEISWCTTQAVPSQDDFIFLRNVIDVDFGQEDFIFDEQSFWVPLRQKPQTRVRMLEMFAGGFGGWHRATQFRQGFSPLQFQTVALEQDLNVAATYAISHSTCLLKSIEGARARVFADSKHNWIVVTDVNDPSWHRAVGEFAPDVIAISSPCQPWSGASTSPGLIRSDGRLLLSSILTCRWFRPKCIMLEQVSAFATHQHKIWIVKALLHIGYVIAWQKVVELADQSPTKRARWLAVATRVYAECTPQPTPNWFVLEHCTPKSVGAVINWCESERLLLEPSEEIKAIAKDPRFFKGPKPFKGFDVGEQILRHRTFQTDQKIPTFMALYGSQHGLNKEFLEKHGYFGHFLSDPCNEGHPRFWHPAEVALIHGITSPILIQEVLPFSWLIIGNAIAEQHALFVLIDVCHRITGERFSPFILFQQYQQTRFRTWQIKLHHIDSDFLILPANHSCISEEFDEHVRQLKAAVDQMTPFAFWSPTQGCVLTWLDFEPVSDMTENQQEYSQVTEGEGKNGVDVTATISFATTMDIDIRLTHDDDRHGCCVASSVTKETVQTLWHDSFEFMVQGEELILQPIKETTSLLTLPPWSDDVLLLFDSTAMTVGVRDASGELHEDFRSSLEQCYDLFGTDFVHSFSHLTPAYFKQKFAHTRPVTDLMFLQAAALQATAFCDWQPSTDTVYIRAVGSETTVKVLIGFWKAILTPETLAGIGRQISSHESFIAIEPASYSVLPPLPTLELLAVLATRALLDELSKGILNPKVIAIKWKGGVLWQGSLPDDLTLTTLASILRLGLQPIIGLTPISMISKGKRVPFDTVLQQLEMHRTLPYAMIHVVEQLAGGGPSKNQTRTIVKNSIAGLLLEQGHDLQWVSTSVEQLMTKVGLPKLQQIIALSSTAAKISAIDALCHEHGIQKVEQAKPTSKALVDGAPWNKSKKPKKEKSLDPIEFKITNGYFLNEDDTAVQQIPQLRAQATGLCLMTHQRVQPWLRGNQTVSADELAAFVLGQQSLDTTLKVRPYTIPCTNADGESVLLAGQLIQFGSKEIKPGYVAKTPLTNEDCQLCALTLYKTDWSGDQWNEAIHGIHKFVKTILAEDGNDQAVLALWGRSMRNGKTPASPAQCTSIQVHCTISKAKLDKILATSGYNKLYVTPKDFSGRLDSSLKVLWIPGDIVEVQAISATLTGCLGLVRGQKSLGLRFRHDTFHAAWKKIYPHSSPPEKAAGDLLFKAEGFPFGCTPDTLSQWSTVINWKFSPIKALGPSAWLLRAETHPTKDVEMFNTSPILLRFLPPKAVGEAPILVGPRSRGSDREVIQSSPNVNPDPWASWTGPRLAPPSQPSRAVDGPIEAKFAAQEEKITELRNDLKALVLKQDQTTTTIQQQFQQVEQREQQNLQKIEATMVGIQKDLQQSLSQALATSSKTMDNRMQELKALFMKRKSSDREDDPDSEM